MERVEFPIGKTNTPPRKEFPLAPIKKIATLVSTPFNFRRYTFVDMSIIEYKSVAHIPIMMQSPISSKIEKQSPPLILGQPV